MSTPSRYSQVSRRAVLQGLSVTALLGVVGCSNDAEVLTSASAGTTTSAGTSTTAASTGSSESAATGEMTIGFTYTADSSSSDSGRGGPGGGMVKNPYIAVWVEDTDGNLVKTISLWHLQNGNDQWLSDLQRWYAVAQGDDTGSSGTQAAGSYTVTWDLTDSDGKALSDGKYVLCLEAVREHGSYSVTTADFSYAGKSFSGDVADAGELSGISYSYTK